MKTLVYIGAVLIGAALSAWQHPQTVGAFWESGLRAPTSSAPEPLDDSRADPPTSAGRPPLSRAMPSRPSPGPRVLAGSGLTLTRAVDAGGAFTGYRVTAAPPGHRLAVGDVITDVNGHPAEDSAAGTELLLIALRQGQATVEVGGPAARPPGSQPSAFANSSRTNE